MIRLMFGKRGEMGVPYEIRQSSKADRNAFATWLERQRKISDDIIPPAVHCDGCGAYHADDEWCEYCGKGKPSVPIVRRRLTNTK